jgi:hypothetical protein
MSSIHPSSGSTPAEPAIADFREAARNAPEVHVALDQGHFVVLGQGHMSSSAGSRSVAWVKGDADTTSIFVNALNRSFGAGVAGAVAREFGLEPTPGKPLSSRLVKEALNMAEAAQGALAGVDFLTFLDHSAVSGGAGYRAALSVAGLDASAVSPTQREAIDNAIRARFQEAAAQGASPVEPATAARWLHSELAPLTKPSA